MTEWKVTDMISGDFVLGDVEDVEYVLTEWFDQKNEEITDAIVELLSNMRANRDVSAQEAFLELLVEKVVSHD